MRIGLSSIVGDGFGTGSFQISEIAGVISFPPAGTILSTHTGVEYPIAQGGGVVNANGSDFPNQTCDVDEKADGSGGSYFDWANASNIQYKSYGSGITSEFGNVYVNILSVNYDVGDYANYWYHDGAGSYYTDGSASYMTYGEAITSVTGINTYVNVLGTNYVSGSYDEVYRSDGVGSYYSTFENVSYTANATYITAENVLIEVPSGSGNYFSNGATIEYYHNGSGGTYTNGGGSYTINGTFITSDGGINYYHDGNGGYYP